MKRLVLLNEAQTNRELPSVPDVPPLLLSKNRVFTASLTMSLPPITSNSSAPTIGAYTFTLAGFPGFNSWATSFDQYRIVQVRVDFAPSGSSSATLPGQIATAIDLDDSTAPTSVSDLLQYDTSMLVTSGTFFERRFTPRVANAIYSGGAFSAYGSVKQWIDCDSNSAQHYGLKYVQTVSNTASTPYAPIATAYINFRYNN